MTDIIHIAFLKFLIKEHCYAEFVHELRTRVDKCPTTFSLNFTTLEDYLNTCRKWGITYESLITWGFSFMHAEHGREYWLNVQRKWLIYLSQEMLKQSKQEREMEKKKESIKKQSRCIIAAEELRGKINSLISVMAGGKSTLVVHDLMKAKHIPYRYNMIGVLAKLGLLTNPVRGYCRFNVHEISLQDAENILKLLRAYSSSHSGKPVAHTAGKPAATAVDIPPKHVVVDNLVSVPSTEDKVNACVKFLKSMGYKILKPITKFEEV